MSLNTRNLTFATVVRRSAEQRGDHRAVVLNGEERTYSELLAAGERRARQMLALDLKPGDRLGVLLPNCLEYFEILLGAAMLGVIVVPMNVRFKARELHHLIVDSGMTALFTRSAVEGGADFAALLGEALPGLHERSGARPLSLESAPALRTVLALDSACPAFLTESELAPKHGPLPVSPDADQPLMLMYTSGTTANPMRWPARRSLPASPGRRRSHGIRPKPTAPRQRWRPRRLSAR